MAGLVVVRHTCPFPPVASKVMRDRIFRSSGIQVEYINTITFYIGCRLGDQVAQVVLGYDVQYKAMTDELDVRAFADGFQQRPFHFLAG